MKLFIRLLLFISANFFAPATRLQAADNIQSITPVSKQRTPIEPTKIKKRFAKSSKKQKLVQKQRPKKTAERDLNAGVISVTIFSFFAMFGLIVAYFYPFWLMLCSVAIIIALFIAMLTLIFTKINAKKLDSTQKDKTSMTVAVSLTFSALSLIFLLIGIATTVGFLGIVWWIWLAPIVAWLVLLIMAILLRTK